MNRWFSTITMFSSIQWLFFIFANTVMIPISVASAFDVGPNTMAMMLRVSLVLTGIACIIQGWQGHRFPLMEGHSGLLWGLILNLGMSASSLGLSYSSIGGGIATGILLAALVTIIIVLCNGTAYMQSIFSPMVMSVFLFLLTFQLIFIFFKGMLKTTEYGLDIPISLFSVAIVIFVSFLKLKGNQIVSNFSILIGLLVGWVLYEVLFPDNIEAGVQSADFSVQIFPLGEPNLQFGIIGVSFFAGVLNLTNTIACVNSAEKLFQQKASRKQYSKSIIITSVFSIIGVAFGLVPYTPYTSSIGFLQSTRILDKKPFYIGGGLLAVIGLIPVLGSLLATMPITVGNAVLFVAYLQLFGTAFNSLNGKDFNSNTIFRLAAPVLIGISLMNVSPSLFKNLPVLIQPFISNGLIMGVLISILLEKMVNWSVFEKIELRNS